MVFSINYSINGQLEQRYVVGALFYDGNGDFLINQNSKIHPGDSHVFIDYAFSPHENSGSVTLFMPYDEFGGSGTQLSNVQMEAFLCNAMDNILDYEDLIARSGLTFVCR